MTPAEERAALIERLEVEMLRPVREWRPPLVHTEIPSFAADVPQVVAPKVARVVRLVTDIDKARERAAEAI